MKAVYITKEHKMEIRELPKPDIRQADDVLIGITAASICACDSEIAEGSHPFAGTEMILGHEFGGIVEAAGSAVTDLKPGDKVCVDPVTSCGKCPSCRRKRPNICLSLQTMGVHRNGGFTEYVCVSRKQVHAYRDQTISNELLSLAEPFSIGAQTNYRAGTGSLDKVVVIGSGAIGLCAMQAARMRGAAVMMTDVIENRLSRARDMGADLTADVSRKDFHKTVMDFTDGQGADVIINTACVAGSMEESIAAAAYGARIVTVGLVSYPSQIPQSELTKKELDIYGSRLSTRLFPMVVDGIDRGKLTPDRLVTHRFHFTEIEKGFEIIKTQPQNVCKVVLTFD